MINLIHVARGSWPQNETEHEGELDTIDTKVSPFCGWCTLKNHVHVYPGVAEGAISSAPVASPDLPNPNPLRAHHECQK